MAYGDMKPKSKPKPKRRPKKKPKSKSVGDDPFDDIKEGALKKQLGYKDDDRIPKSQLEKIKKDVVQKRNQKY